MTNMERPERRSAPRPAHQQVEREVHAVERAFVTAIERGDTVSDYLVRKLMAAITGDDRRDRVRAVR